MFRQPEGLSKRGFNPAFGLRPLQTQRAWLHDVGKKPMFQSRVRAQAASDLKSSPGMRRRHTFQSRVRAQAASDPNSPTAHLNSLLKFQSRVRAQAASDRETGLEHTLHGTVSIPRSGSGRFRPKAIWWVRLIIRSFNPAFGLRPLQTWRVLRRRAMPSKFQSRVRAQAASDYWIPQTRTWQMAVSIPRSGSGRFRPGCELCR